MIFATIEAGHEDLRGTVLSLGRWRLPPPPRALASIDAPSPGPVAPWSPLRLRWSSCCYTRWAKPHHPRRYRCRPSTPSRRERPCHLRPRRPFPHAATKISELIHDGRYFTIGRVGDAGVTGDWDCDGTSTPALLRPETGEIAVFADWPGANATITPAAIFVIEGALTLGIAMTPATTRAQTASGKLSIASVDRESESFGQTVQVNSESILLTDVGLVIVETATETNPEVTAPEPHAGSFAKDENVVAPDKWIVEAGERLWAIAEQVLDAAGKPTDDVTVSTHWAQLIAENAAALQSEPDLIYVGQVITLPAANQP